MVAFALTALYYRQYILAGIEGGITVILLIAAIIKKRRFEKRLNAYIESIAYDTETAKNNTLLSCPLPMAVFRLSDTSVVWANDEFFKMFDAKGSRIDAQLSAMVSSFSGKWLLDGQVNYPEIVRLKDRKYQIYGNLIRPEEDEEESAIMGLTYWVDVTDYDNTRILYEESRPVPGVIVIDNLEELTRNQPERVKNEIRESVEDRLQHWCSAYHGLLRRYDRDRYLVVFEKKDIDQMRVNSFSLNEEMHRIESPNGISATISIGFGAEASTLEEGLQFADTGTELALSRGGDQTVIKNRLNFEFYGGRGYEVEKRTKVKSRVVANTLSELIRDSSKVFVMGHKFADLDAVGAAVGICCLTRFLGVKAYIVIDQNNNVSKTLIEQMKKEPEYKEAFLAPNEALLTADARTLLVVVDTNRPEQVEDSGLLGVCNRVAVIDHHRVGATYIQNAALGFIEPYASSAAELVTEILQEQMKPEDVRRPEAEALLAGIVLDTKSFSIRTGERTFDAAGWLRRSGADTAEIKKLLQLDLDTAISKYKLIENAKLYRGVAIAVSEEKVERVVAAQAADEMLNIAGVEASIVASADDCGNIHVSARSIGNLNVQILMEKMGGGGNRSAAAVKLENTTTTQAEEKILSAIDDYLGSQEN